MGKGAWKTLFVDNLGDVLTKINYQSDPVIRLYEADLVCDYCLSGSHTTISCRYVVTDKVELLQHQGQPEYSSSVRN